GAESCPRRGRCWGLRCTAWRRVKRATAPGTTTRVPPARRAGSRRGARPRGSLYAVESWARRTARTAVAGLRRARRRTEETTLKLLGQHGPGPDTILPLGAAPRGHVLPFQSHCPSKATRI